ncbi:MAG: LamG domain-containing protein [Bacteroidetes bacterium]|nr:LamG domain-containing protein [Bacteroidota bacterium]
MAIFLRQSHNIKPPLWGSPADRQYAIWRNLEDIYRCNHESEVLIMPLFWGLPPMDYSGQNNHGTNHGATYKDGSLDFDGGDDYVDLPNDIVPVTTIASEGVTLNAWVKIDTLGILKAIVGQKSDVDHTHFSSGGIRVSNNNKAQITVYNGAYKHLEGTTVLNTTNLYHIVGTFDPSDDQTRIYVNGNLENTSVGNSGVFLAGTNIGYIGRKHYSVGHEFYFNGLIDEVRISNVARTADQIALFNDNKYGLYQPVSRPIWSIPAAEGISIPIAQYYYQQQRV